MHPMTDVVRAVCSAQGLAVVELPVVEMLPDDLRGLPFVSVTGDETMHPMTDVVRAVCSAQGLAVVELPVVEMLPDDLRGLPFVSVPRHQRLARKMKHAERRETVARRQKALRKQHQQEMRECL